ncbi:MAG: hypothetical protein ACI4DV_08770 [Lachnospiraceae bacterium]
MKRKSGYFILAAVFVLLVLGTWLKSPEAYSLSERRRLAQFPHVSAEAVRSGRFMTEFEAYTLDQFPFREAFRTLKAVVSDRIFGRLDNHGIYVADGYAAALEYPMNEESLKHAAKRFSDIYERYLEDSRCRICFSVIPDKNYWLAKKNGYPVMDYTKFFEQMQDFTPWMEYVDITGLLDIEDYYRTDTHWRQENLVDVAEWIGKAMDVDIDTEYERKLWTENFHGVYTGQSALPMEGEPLYYLTNETMENCRVYDHENDREIEIYDKEKGAGADPYELFLSGPLSLITIKNPANTGGKELILFRDSFASSIAPLLAEGYARITLVDIRYLMPQMLGKYVEFTDQDVLFLYSTSVLNHSETLK